MTDRKDLSKKAGSRVLALLWSAVILIVALPFAAVLWISWMVISIPGTLLLDTSLFRWSGGAPGFAFASETFSWFQTNLDHSLFGTGRSVQWTPEYSVDRWEEGV